MPVVLKADRRCVVLRAGFSQVTFDSCPSCISRLWLPRAACACASVDGSLTDSSRHRQTEALVAQILNPQVSQNFWPCKQGRTVLLAFTLIFSRVSLHQLGVYGLKPWDQQPQQYKYPLPIWHSLATYHPGEECLRGCWNTLSRNSIRYGYATSAERSRSRPGPGNLATTVTVDLAH